MSDPNPLRSLAIIAESQIGKHETGTNTGSDVIRYQRATNIKGTGWAWCAAFVCWCIAQLFALKLKSLGLRSSELPTTARAFEFEAWGRKIGAMVWRKGSKDRPFSPERGDIVIYTFSHIGIVTRGLNAAGKFEAVEGNTGKAGQREGTHVLPKPRGMSEVRCLIRLPLKAQRV